MSRNTSFSVSLALAISAVGAIGCIDASQKPCMEPNAGAGTPAPGASPAAGALKTCSNAVTTPDGLVDDFEDGNTQLVPLEGRDGYWWTHHDPNGSTLEPAKFAPEDGGATGKGLHVKGNTSSTDGAYGSEIGVNLSNTGLYDASKYVGIAFKAKVGPSSTKKVRFKVGDVNTHGQLGSCKSCWNHFGKDFEFSTEWKEYRLLFSEATQAQGWGDPRPKNITPAQLASLSWSIGPGAAFELFVDDVQFLNCP